MFFLRSSPAPRGPSRDRSQTAIAAKGRFHSACKPFIDEDLAGADAAYRAVRGIDIGGEDAADKPVLGAVGDLDSLILDPLFRTETGRTPRCRQSACPGDVRDHCRGEERPGKVQPPSASGVVAPSATAASTSPSARSRCGSDTIDDTPELTPVDPRADRQPLGKRHTALDELVMDILVAIIRDIAEQTCPALK